MQPQHGVQTRQVVEQTRQRMAAEARSQTERAASSLRQWSDELASMAESSKPDSPVSEAVHQIADTGRRAADYLDRRGFEGAVGELQEFARRKPGTFLLGAAIAGYLVGRAAKATTQATDQAPGQGYESQPGYSPQPASPPETGQGTGNPQKPQAVPGQGPLSQEPMPGRQQRPYGQEAVPGQQQPYGEGIVPAGESFRPTTPPPGEVS